jgi:hypothetical protein
MEYKATKLALSLAASLGEPIIDVIDLMLALNSAVYFSANIIAGLAARQNYSLNFARQTYLLDFYQCYYTLQLLMQFYQIQTLTKLQKPLGPTLYSCGRLILWYFFSTTDSKDNNTELINTNNDVRTSPRQAMKPMRLLAIFYVSTDIVVNLRWVLALSFMVIDGFL